LGGALAGNAAIVGWHAWMGALDSAFLGTGLRDDAGDGGDAASAAVPRQAWFAYAVLAQLLDDKVSWGRMVLPVVTSRKMLQAAVSVDPCGSGIVVFELYLEGGSTVLPGEWAYLVLRDPSVESSARAFATPTGAATALAGIRKYTNLHLSLELSGGSDTALPVWSVTPVYTLLPSTDILADPSVSSPTLYISSRRLSWTLLRAPSSTSASTSSVLHSRPDWMDDGGARLPGSSRGAAGADARW